MARPAAARIDLNALCHNYRWLRQQHGGRAFAVLKANAYGHGAVRCAHALQADPAPADALAVAFVEEAVALREAGISLPILVLEGAFDAQDMQAVHHHALWTVVHQADQLTLLEGLPASAKVHAWLKLDTGMHRAGFAPASAHAVWATLNRQPSVASVSWMTHLACADEPDNPTTLAQIRCFDEATAGLNASRSIANSAAVLGWPQARRDWARPGIAMYGAPPVDVAGHALRPVMQLVSEVFAVRMLQPGQALGYGGTWVATRPSRIGLVALGYADGYPRGLMPGATCRVHGQPCPIVGRVSMDMLTVDLTDLPDADIGTELEFWGADMPVNEVARHANTISYELLCGVQRVTTQVTDIAPQTG